MTTRAPVKGANFPSCDDPEWLAARIDAFSLVGVIARRDGDPAILIEQIRRVLDAADDLDKVARSRPRSNDFR